MTSSLLRVSRLPVNISNMAAITNTEAVEIDSCDIHKETSDLAFVVFSAVVITQIAFGNWTSLSFVFSAGKLGDNVCIIICKNLVIKDIFLGALFIPLTFALHYMHVTETNSFMCSTKRVALLVVFGNTCVGLIMYTGRLLKAHAPVDKSNCVNNACFCAQVFVNWVLCFVYVYAKVNTSRIHTNGFGFPIEDQTHKDACFVFYVGLLIVTTGNVLMRVCLIPSNKTLAHQNQAKAHVHERSIVSTRTFSLWWVVSVGCVLLNTVMDVIQLDVIQTLGIVLIAANSLCNWAMYLYVNILQVS